MGPGPSVGLSKDPNMDPGPGPNVGLSRAQIWAQIGPKYGPKYWPLGPGPGPCVTLKIYSVYGMSPWTSIAEYLGAKSPNKLPSSEGPVEGPMEGPMGGTY